MHRCVTMCVQTYVVQQATLEKALLHQLASTCPSQESHLPVQCWGLLTCGASRAVTLAPPTPSIYLVRQSSGSHPEPRVARRPDIRALSPC